MRAPLRKLHENKNQYVIHTTCVWSLALLCSGVLACRDLCFAANMAHNLLVVGFGDRPFNFPVTGEVATSTLKGWLDQRLGTGAEFHLTRGGAPLTDTDIIPCDGEWSTTLIRAHPILHGGKGGFGALIRAVGSRRKRGGGSKEACRDLSGRRLRDVNAQKKVTKWLEDEPERKRKRREEKRKRLLAKKVPPKHFFDDQAYMEQLRSNEEGMDSALKQGLKASVLKRKEPASEDAADVAGPSTSKKHKFWVGDEDEDDLSSDESSEMDSEQDSHSADDTVNKPEPGNSKIQAVLNSAGSSDEGTHSKPSDEEDSESIQKSTPHSDSGSVADEGGGADKTTGVTEELSRVNERETEGERSVGDGCNTAQEKANTEGAEEVEKAEAGGKNKEKEAPESHNEENKEEIPANHTPPQDNGPIDLNHYSSAEELESAGAERLKAVLMSMGLKCGGTLQERAQRLFSTKGKSPDELDSSLFAKAGKSRKRKNKAQ